MNFGPETTEPDSHAIMDRALEHGINFFDTDGRVRTEGRRRHHRADHRPLALLRAAVGGDKVVLATKVYGKSGELAQRPGTVRPATSSRA